MEYRQARQADIKTLINMRMAYLQEDYSVIIEEERAQLNNQLPNYFKQHLNKDLKAYIALDKGKIVAVALLLIIEKPANPSFLTGKIGNVLNVYTMPEYRKQGIASRLMGQMICDAKLLELSYIELKATKMGRSLYEDLGFESVQSSYTIMQYKVHE